MITFIHHPTWSEITRQVTDADPWVQQGWVADTPSRPAKPAKTRTQWVKPPTPAPAPDAESDHTNP